MNLEQIKNEYAKDQGFKNWDFLFFERQFNEKRMCDDWHKVIELAQKECLKIASEKYIATELPNGNYEVLPKDQLLNENNIIK